MVNELIQLICDWLTMPRPGLLQVAVQYSTNKVYSCIALIFISASVNGGPRYTYLALILFIVHCTLYISADVNVWLCGGSCMLKPGREDHHGMSGSFNFFIDGLHCDFLDGDYSFSYLGPSGVRVLPVAAGTNKGGHYF